MQTDKTLDISSAENPDKKPTWPVVLMVLLLLGGAGFWWMKKGGPKMFMKIPKREDLNSDIKIPAPSRSTGGKGKYTDDSFPLGLYSSGPKVKAVQAVLKIAVGAPKVLDGKWGPATQVAYEQAKTAYPPMKALLGAKISKEAFTRFTSYFKSKGLGALDEVYAHESTVASNSQEALLFEHGDLVGTFVSDQNGWVKVLIEGQEFLVEGATVIVVPSSIAQQDV